MKANRPAPPARPLRWAWGLLLPVAGAGALWAARAAWDPSGGDPDRLWREAAAEFEARRPKEAEARLARLDRLRPPTEEEQILRAKVVGAQGRIDEAIADLRRIPDVAPLAPRARLLQGQIERDRSRARFAEAALREALRLDPKLVQARRELVYIYGMQLRRADLRAQLLALTELTAPNFEDAFLMCLSRGVLWEPGEAAGILRRFVEADPEDRASRLALADNLQRLSRHAEAEAVLARLPEEDPDARAARAQSALDLGDLRRAEALLSAGPADHPGQSRLRGRLALVRRDWAGAAQEFRAALAAEPHSRDALRGLGEALSQIDPPASKPYLALARAHDRLNVLLQHASTAGARRDDRVLLLELGAACRGARLFPEARSWYRLAIKLDPLDTETQRQLFEIDSAEPHPPTP